VLASCFLGIVRLIPAVSAQTKNAFSVRHRNQLGVFEFGKRSNPTCFASHPCPLQIWSLRPRFERNVRISAPPSPFLRSALNGPTRLLVYRAPRHFYTLPPQAPALARGLLRHRGGRSGGGPSGRRLPSNDGDGGGDDADYDRADDDDDVDDDDEDEEDEKEDDEDSDNNEEQDDEGKDGDDDDDDDGEDIRRVGRRRPTLEYSSRRARKLCYGGSFTTRQLLMRAYIVTKWR
jgi:hypothetical protein